MTESNNNIAALTAGLAAGLEEVKKMVQRSLDYMEVQNVMARHMHYHTAGKHHEELDNIWAQKTPGVSFSQNHGHYVGMESIRKYYGDFHDLKCQDDLKRIKEHFPGVEITPENFGMGTLVVHPLTSACIEIAGDGQTAKGVWYSPGQITEIGPDGKPFAMWMWEKYGVDFVKEDGSWKIWHIHMYYDIAAPVGGPSWTEIAMERELDPVPRDHGNDMGNLPQPDIKELNYNIYGWKTVPQMNPRLPEPYETFSETFSYGPPTE